MALQTETYANIKANTEALLGVTLSTGETTRFDALLNQYARKAYNASNYWQRWVVTGEPRSVSSIQYPSQANLRTEVDGIVQHTETGFPTPRVSVSGGVACLTGICEFDGLVNGLASWKLTNCDGQTAVLSADTTTGKWKFLFSDADGSSLLSVSSDDTLATLNYTLPASGAGWTGITVTYGDYDEADTFLRIHKKAPYKGLAAPEYFFHVVDNGAILNTSSIPDYAYVTYRKRLTDTYGDGSGGTVSSIPLEWADYIAYGIALDMEMATRNITPDHRSLSRVRLKELLDDELIKIDDQNIADHVASRTLTHRNT